MDANALSLSGFFLIFILGIRHGFDPDHIAMIDAMVYRTAIERPALAAWTGTLFALGHGLTVTLIAVGLGMLSASMTDQYVLLPAVAAILEWMPVAFLFLVGTLNLRELLRPQAYQARGWKMRFIPARLRSSSHPLAIFLIGFLFALVFDTAAQAAAWGYAATSHAGLWMALWLGLVFTAGMVITDTLDSRLMVQLLQRMAHRTQAQTYRRKIGWVIVGMSYGIGIYAIATAFYPSLELNDSLLTVIGVTMVVSMFGTYIWLLRKPALQPQLQQQLQS
jgi:nickel/cobalt transporter (NiCoT) family protein